MTSFEQAVRFNPESLLAGNKDEILKWVHGEGSSIYVRWIPVELLPDNSKPVHLHAANILFGRYGKIDRVEYVPKYGANGKVSGHMMFVHYEFWWLPLELPQKIAESYPQSLEFAWGTLNRQYTLNLCINTTPIKKVEYNPSQLTDMFERLNKRVMTELADMRKICDELKTENQNLRDELQRAVYK